MTASARAGKTRALLSSLAPKLSQESNRNEEPGEAGVSGPHLLLVGFVLTPLTGSSGAERPRPLSGVFQLLVLNNFARGN